MTFLVLLLTVGAYKVMGWHFSARHDGWFVVLCDRLERTLVDAPRLALLLSLLIPLGVVSVALQLLGGWLFGFAGVLLQALILAYALGRVNLFDQLQRYLQTWRSGDIQSAYHQAQKDFNLDIEFEADSRNSLHGKVCQGLLYQWFEQVFVIVFWYLLAGPLAALFIRLLSLYEQREPAKTGLQLLHMLEWLPARLLALTFAIAGNFTLCFKTWLKAIGSFEMSTAVVLFKSSLAAIGLNEAQLGDSSAEQQAGHLDILQSLLVRSLVVWMMFVALLVIF
ncbi:MAG: regulatory signaling modulator protein AmpE [Pseudomonadales bacterium]